MKQFYCAVIVLISAIFLAACGTRGNDLEAALAELEGPHTEVIVQRLEPGPGNQPESEYQPPKVIIPPGATVVWISEDSGPHSITEGTPGELDPAFDEELPPGSYVMHTFTEPGVYTYYCKYHEAEVGEVRVEDVTPVAP